MMLPTMRLRWVNVPDGIIPPPGGVFQDLYASRILNRSLKLQQWWEDSPLLPAADLLTRMILDVGEPPAEPTGEWRDIEVEKNPLLRKATDPK